MRNHFGTERFQPFFRDYLLPDASGFERRFFEEILKLFRAGDDAYAFWKSWSGEDVRHLAPRVRAPTLVGHVRGDHLIPLDSGLEVAQLIPGSKLLLVEGSNHILLPGDSEGVRTRDALREFLDE